MSRREFRWTLTEGGTSDCGARSERFLDEGVRYAMGTALDAGIAAVRAVARAEGQLYGRQGATRTPSETRVHWRGESDGRELVVTVRRPS